LDGVFESTLRIGEIGNCFLECCRFVFSSLHCYPPTSFVDASQYYSDSACESSIYLPLRNRLRQNPGSTRVKGKILRHKELGKAFSKLCVVKYSLPAPASVSRK
jgi:hypothetical protein